MTQCQDVLDSLDWRLSPRSMIYRRFQGLSDEINMRFPVRGRPPPSGGYRSIWHFIYSLYVIRCFYAEWWFFSPARRDDNALLPSRVPQSLPHSLYYDKMPKIDGYMPDDSNARTYNFSTEKAYRVSWWRQQWMQAFLLKVYRRQHTFYNAKDRHKFQHTGAICKMPDY